MDYKTHLMHLSGNVKISQGDISIAADAAEATNMESRDSHWVFTGNVHMRAESQGDLRADHATVEITQPVSSPAPSSAVHPRSSSRPAPSGGSPARGHASTIDYNVAAGTVKLTGDALLNMARGPERAQGTLHHLQRAQPGNTGRLRQWRQRRT